MTFLAWSALIVLASCEKINEHEPDYADHVRHAVLLYSAGYNSLSYDMDADIQEERRLFYVGMTRAKDKLYLYYAKERYGQELSCSRFIEELRGDGTPKPGQGEKRRQTI